jgi:hypothetical protein
MATITTPTDDRLVERPHSAEELYGLMAEFDTQEELLAAAHATHRAGYRHTDAYSPFPVHGVAEALGLPRSRVPLLVLVGGLVGFATGLLMQYWMTVIAYPINVGGRPMVSWPSWVVPTFETTVLFAAFAAVFGMFALNRLPMPYHPAFNAPNFERASEDGFFLCIEATDPNFRHEDTLQFLQGLKPRQVTEVQH